MGNDNSHRFNRRSLLKTAGTAAIASGLATTATAESSDRVRRSGVEFETSDGVTLVGDLVYPADDDGNIADGPFPVVLTMTPYNRNTEEERSVSALHLVDHGYIRGSFDVRGTGSSGGRFRAWGPREQQDYVELVDWVADLPRSTGSVGLYGGSYLGHGQLLAAGRASPDSPIDALFPIVAATDVWRTANMTGGLVSAASYWYAGAAGVTPESAVLGADEMSFEELQERTVDHAVGYYDTNVDILVGEQLRTEHGYRDDYWRDRSVTRALPGIVENDIPVFHYTAWFDVFQPESLEVFTELQNLWAGRDQYAPMHPKQTVTGRYQSAVGPYFHLEGIESVPDELPLRWFDRFLKGERNGIDETETPLHVFQAYGDRWVESKTWPLAETTVETFYLGGGTTGTAPHSLNDGWLRTGQPDAIEASDTLPWFPTSYLCQQADHESTMVTEDLRELCGDDNRTWETTALTYTSEPFEEARNLAGPSSVTIYASADTTNTSWVASLSAVTPDGVSKQLGYGALLGSFRKLNEEQSWMLEADDQGLGPRPHPVADRELGKPTTDDGDGKLIRPRHDYTKLSEEPVEPGQVERYDLLLTPMFARIHEGHRLRLTIQTTAPWAEPAAKDVDDLAGGIYNVQRNEVYPSALNIPIAGGSLTESTEPWGPCNYACEEP